MNCPKKDCNKPGFKKYENPDGSTYYYCSSCHYETKPNKPRYVKESKLEVEKLE
jgi:hypothetical protein